MKIINGERGSGKSTAIIRTAEIMNAQIITPTRRMATGILHDAREMGANIKNPVSWDEIRNNPHKFPGPYLVDEAEEVIEAALRETLKGDVLAITVTKPRFWKSFIPDEARQQIREANPKHYAEGYGE